LERKARAVVDNKKRNERAHGSAVVAVTLAITTAGAGLLNARGAEWMLAYAGACEFAGVVLVASPEMSKFASMHQPSLDGLRRVPADLRVWALRRRWLPSGVRRLLRRDIHLTPDTVRIDLSTSASLSLKRNPPTDTTLDATITYLLEQGRRHQERFERIEGDLHAQAKQHEANVHRLNWEILEARAKAADDVVSDRLGLRLSGVALLLIGIGLATWGNLL
jgi:hypothetical protein